MKKVIAITLLIVGFALALASTPIDTAGGLDNIPDPQVMPLSQKNAM